MKLRCLFVTLILLLSVIVLAGCAGKEEPEPTPLPTVQLEPAITAPPTPTPTPKPSIGPYFEPTVTKSPGGEIKVEGSCMYFSAFAEDMVRCQWELFRDDEVLDWDNPGDEFSEMKIAGIYDNYLMLGNVPMALDGWSVRCKFVGTGNAVVYSESADISILERTVKIHGEDRKTVRGTGNVSCYGAVIDFEGEDWWKVEEYAGASFILLPQDTDRELGIKKVVFQVFEDGSVSLTIDDKEYLGFVSSERIGGFTPSAGMMETGSDAEITVFFDYTAESQRWESWDRIFLQIPLEIEQKADETAPAADAAKAPEDTSETGSTEETPSVQTVEFILTRN